MKEFCAEEIWAINILLRYSLYSSVYRPVLNLKYIAIIIWNKFVFLYYLPIPLKREIA